MFRNSLTVGDIIKIKAWFGWIETELVKIEREVYAVSKNRDIQVPVRFLSHADKSYSMGSKWEYIGKSKEVEGQYIEFVEENDNSNDLLKDFINNI
jgi:hypothetical protein